MRLPCPLHYGPTTTAPVSSGRRSSSLAVSLAYTSVLLRAALSISLRRPPLLPTEAADPCTSGSASTERASSSGCAWRSWPRGAPRTRWSSGCSSGSRPRRRCSWPSAPSRRRRTRWRGPRSRQPSSPRAAAARTATTMPWRYPRGSLRSCAGAWRLRSARHRRASGRPEGGRRGEAGRGARQEAGGR